MVIDTRKQDGKLLGHVYGTAKKLPKAIDMRTELVEAVGSKAGVPTIWTTTTTWEEGEPVRWDNPRISVMKPAELKQMGEK